MGAAIRDQASKGCRNSVTGKRINQIGGTLQSSCEDTVTNAIIPDGPSGQVGVCVGTLAAGAGPEAGLTGLTLRWGFTKAGLPIGLPERRAAIR